MRSRSSRRDREAELVAFYGKEFASRLLIGTAGYPSPAIMQDAVRASGAEIVTVSLRRESAGGRMGNAFWSLIWELGVTVLPNTAGCRSVREAVTTAQLARELFDTPWIKLEVIGDEETLQPEVVGLVEAAAILVKDGFEVFAYCTEDLTVALRQGAFQAWFAWIFYLPLAVIGFPPLMFLTVSSFNTLYQFWIHTRTIGRLGPLELVLNTPSNHRVHHGRNPKYIDRNHGGTLIIWDRLFGTFQGEEEEPVYGITKPLASWNPVWANLHYWVELARTARRANRFSDQVRVFLKPGVLDPQGKAINEALHRLGHLRRLHAAGVIHDQQRLQARPAPADSPAFNPRVSARAREPACPQIRPPLP